MPVHVQEKGSYELIETTNGNRILVLEGELWYAWVEGRQGEILVQSDADHERRRTLQEGRFYVVAFEDDPAFRDVPHLFLEKEGRFQEIVLPNGLPTEQDVQKKIIATDHMIDSATLERHLQPPPPKDEGESAVEGETGP